jgi:hypothetical protein
MGKVNKAVQCMNQPGYCAGRQQKRTLEYLASMPQKQPTWGKGHEQRPDCMCRNCEVWRMGY